jgi:hypothetical protein
MNPITTLENARLAKQRAADDLAFREGVVGIGLTMLGDVYAIKVNVATSEDAASIPSQFADVPVVVDVVGSIAALTKP